MAVDPNEIAGWVRECTNVAYLRGLKDAVNERLGQLGAPLDVPPPQPLTLENVRELRKPPKAEVAAAEAAKDEGADLPPAPPLPLELTEGKPESV
jgi:hypothetical protein